MCKESYTLSYIHVYIISFDTLDNMPVYISTFQDSGYNNEAFQLAAGSGNLLLHGMLCENGSYFCY